MGSCLALLVAGVAVTAGIASQSPAGPAHAASTRPVARPGPRPVVDARCVGRPGSAGLRVTGRIVGARCPDGRIAPGGPGQGSRPDLAHVLTRRPVVGLRDGRHGSTARNTVDRPLRRIGRAWSRRPRRGGRIRVEPPRRPLRRGRRPGVDPSTLRATHDRPSRVARRRRAHGRHGTVHRGGGLVPDGGVAGRLDDEPSLGVVPGLLHGRHRPARRVDGCPGHARGLRRARRLVERLGGRVRRRRQWQRSRWGRRLRGRRVCTRSPASTRRRACSERPSATTPTARLRPRERGC